MEIRLEIVWIIIGMAVVTWLPRVLPLMVLSRLRIPDWGMRWLHYVPVSIITALIAQELFIEDGKLAVFAHRSELLAAGLTFAVALWTRSLLGTVLAGMLFIVAFRYLL